MDGRRAVHAAHIDRELQLQSCNGIIDKLNSYIETDIQNAIDICTYNIESEQQDQIYSSHYENTENDDDLMHQDNDNQMLQYPLQLCREDIKPKSQQLISLPPWMVGTMKTDLYEQIGVNYTWSQLRLLLLKGKIVFEEKISEIRRNPESMPGEVVDLYVADPDSFANAVFSIFLYTCNFCDCRCSNLQMCINHALEERKFLSSYTGVFQSAIHPKETTLPPNQVALGYHCSLWALTNWALRVSRGSAVVAESDRRMASLCVEVLEPFQVVLYYALSNLRPTYNTIFRGIRGRVEYPYARGDAITWPSFSSTSTAGSVARSFMGDSEGTFFVISTCNGSTIDWFSWFKLEKEVLLRMNSNFEVKGRMSNTLLSMLGSQAEIISMSELGKTVPTPYQEAENAITLLLKTVFLYSDFLEKYVVGYVSAAPNMRTGGVRLDEALAIFLESITSREGNPDDLCPSMVILGSAGAGKTSSVLYILSSIVQTLSTTLNYMHDTNSSPVVPVFVPLPGTKFCDHGGVDAFILQEMHVSSEGFSALCAAPRRVVLLLDSLDEVDFKGSKSVSEVVMSLLQRNPMVSANVAGIILSSRGEFYADNNFNPQHTFGRSASSVRATKVYHVQPFVDDDMDLFLQRSTSSSKNKTMNHSEMVQHIKSRGLWEHVRNPFLLHMLVSTLLMDPDELVCAGEGRTGYGLFELYESYFKSLYRVTAERNTSAHDAETFISQAEVIAFALHCDGVSQGLVSTYGSLVPSLLHLPLRLEVAYVPVSASANENPSTLSFRHKSLQEFLVARCIYNDLVSNSEFNSDRLIERCGYLSSHPNVIRHFSDRLCRDETNRTVVCEHLSAVLRYSSDYPISVSNALTLLSHSQVVISNFVKDLSGVNIYNANLNGGIFTGVDLTDATWTDCSVKGIDLSHSVVWNLSTLGCKTYLQPSMHCKFPVASIACSYDGKYIALCGDNKLVLIDAESSDYAELLSVEFTGDMNRPTREVSFSDDSRFLGVVFSKNSLNHFHGSEHMSYAVFGSVESWLHNHSELRHHYPSSEAEAFVNIKFSYHATYTLLCGSHYFTMLSSSTNEALVKSDVENEHDRYQCGEFTPDESYLLLFWGRFEITLYALSDDKSMSLTPLWIKNTYNLFEVNGWGDVRDISCMKTTVDGEYLYFSGSCIVGTTWRRLLNLSSDNPKGGYDSDRYQIEKELGSQIRKKQSQGLCFTLPKCGKYLLKYFEDAAVVFDMDSTARVSSIAKSGCKDAVVSYSHDHILLTEKEYVNVYDFDVGAQELMYRSGHMNVVRKMHPLPGGKYIISSGADSRNFIHSTISNASVLFPDIHEKIYDYKFSQCGRLMMILAADSGSPSDVVMAVRLDPEAPQNSKVIFSQRGFNKSCTSFSPSGTYVAFYYCSYDWDSNTKECTERGAHIYRGVHIVPVEEVLHMEEEKLHSVSNEGWRPEWSSNAIVYEDFGLGYVCSIAWAPTRSHDVTVAVINVDECICSVYSLAVADSAKKVQLFQIENAKVHDMTKAREIMTYSECGSYLYFYNYGCFMLTMYDVSNPQNVQVLNSLEDIADCYFSPLRHHFAAVCKVENSLSVYSATDFRKLKIVGSNGIEQCMHVSLSESSYNESWKRTNTDNLGMSWSQDNKLLAFASNSSGIDVVLLNLSHSSSESADIIGTMRGSCQARCITFSEDVRYCFVGYENGSIRQFSIMSSDMNVLACVFQYGPETPTFSTLGATGVDSIRDNETFRRVSEEFVNFGNRGTKTLLGGNCVPFGAVDIEKHISQSQNISPQETNCVVHNQSKKKKKKRIKPQPYY